MVTGSHNPPDYNGFKVAFGRTTLFGEEVQEIADIIEGRRFTSGQRVDVRLSAHQGRLLRFMRGNISIERPLRVVVDAGNGTGGVVALPIMEEMGARNRPSTVRWTAISPTTSRTRPSRTNLGQLIETVLETVGRPGHRLRRGRGQDRRHRRRGRHHLGRLPDDHIRQGDNGAHKGAAFVSEVKCSKNLFADIAKRGGRPVMWKAGHSLIKQKMKETGGALRRRDERPHVLRGPFFGFDDAIYASLRLLEILAKGRKALSEFLSDLPPTGPPPRSGWTARRR